MKSIAALALFTACTADVEPDQVDAVLALEGDPEIGARLYDAECVQCHDEDGLGVKIAPLQYAMQELSDESVVYTILAGPLIMPNFERRLADQEVADVLAYLRETWGP